jgi:ABC-type multidrug transport system ATPase subunit
MKGLAGEGRTVFVSSHLLSEMALTADHVVVIGKGRLLAQLPTADLIARSSQNFVKVRSPEVAALKAALDHSSGPRTETCQATDRRQGVAMPRPAASPPRIRTAPAAVGQRQPPDDIARAEPVRIISIGLDLFCDWSIPQGFRYQRGFSTRSGNDGK